jgi:release factor glutamine methyltransferase
MLLRLKDALREGANTLKKARIETPVVEAGVILCFILNCDKSFIYSHNEYQMDVNETKKFFEHIEKRAAGVPVQYLTGHQEFMSMDFRVTRDVLIPRQDTEVLVETVIAYAEILSGKGAGNEKKGAFISILDMGTGSGCIAVSLAKYIRNCRVVAVDISEEALGVARYNAANNGVQDKIDFIKSDLFSELEPMKKDKRFDIIVSNPPYIPSREINSLQKEVKQHEPVIALDGGADGLKFYRFIIADAPAYLKPGEGLLALEVGYGQAEAVCRLMNRDFCEIKVINDLSGIRRTIIGKLYTKFIAMWLKSFI